MINEELDKEAIGCKNKFSNLVGVAPIGSFSWALMRLKEGAKIQRKGWNGKGMWVPSISDLFAEDWEEVK